MQMEYTLETFKKLYLRGIVRYHGVPKEIISDRTPSLLRCFGGLCK